MSAYLPPTIPAIIQSENINSVSKLTDIYPRDWSFKTLQDLISRYQVTGVSLVNKKLSRLEFAIAFTTFIQSCQTCSFSPEDLLILQRLQKDFAEDLKILNRQLTSLDSKVTNLEKNSFATNTTLSGEIIIGVSQAFGDDIQDNLVLQQRVKLDFNTSFTGKDQLKISLTAGNAEQFTYGNKITNEGRLGFTTDTNNQFEISNLSYRFPINDNLTVFLASQGDDVNPVNPFFSSRGQGSISRFGRKNPIYRLVETGGIALSYKFNDSLTFGIGYYGGELNNSQAGQGIFNGDYSFASRLKFQPNENISLGLLYIHSYNDSNLSTGTGSIRSQLDLDRPLTANSYSLEASFQINSNFAMGGWIGFTNANIINLGSAEVWNYALTLSFPELLQEDDLFGIIIGQEPKLTGTSGFLINGKRRDTNTSLHIESFYRYPLTDNISLTPGLIWITAPNHNVNNSDIFILTIRTTLRF
jgi:Carbohydrate-selective porin, OprB family